MQSNDEHIPVYAIDFDGTLCEKAYPGIGEPKQIVIDRVKKLKDIGYLLILWTCRSGERLKEAIVWCELQGLVFDAVNENLQSEIEAWGTDPRKVAADYYVDDRAIPIEWIAEIEQP